MKIETLVFALLLISNFFAYAQAPTYPVFPKQETEISYFDTSLIDKFSQLEQTQANEVRTWIEAQNDFAETKLKGMVKKHHTKHLLKRLGFRSYNLPIKKGGYYFRWYYYREDRPAGLYYQRGIWDEVHLVIDPVDLGWNENVDIGSYSVSKNGKYIAFSYGENGSDWREIRVKKLGTNALIKDKIVEAKFTYPKWRGDGFYYDKYTRNGQWDAEQYQGIFYHRLGTDQSEDELVFRDKSKIDYNIDLQVTEDERFVFLYKKNKDTGKTTVLFKDYQLDNPTFKPLLVNIEQKISILGNDNERFYAMIESDRRGRSVIYFDLIQPKKWNVAVPPVEGAELLHAKLLNDFILCEYMDKTAPLVLIFNKNGEVVKSLPFEKGYSINGFEGGQGDENTVYYIMSYHVPPVVFELDLNTFKSELVSKTEVYIKPEEYKITSVEYPSNDGTLVPMTIFSKKEKLKKTGKTPVLLHTYGGFGSIHNPSFDEKVLLFLEKGGIYAYAHVRGEGNMGKAWVEGGKNMKKQNSIDDFIAAAEYLIRENYTNPSKIAITGASNGGMMVGAAMVKRPDLFKVAVPVVGVFDMVNFEKYTIGAFHKKEYGTIENKDEFYNLLSYSPYHNIKKGVNYPATLIMTAENDDRVPPFHSYKFAARLQDNPAQKNPILLRTESKAGHYGASTYKGSIEEEADMMAFILEQLGM